MRHFLLRVTDSTVQKLDLDAYFARVGFEGARGPQLETLRSLHRAHVTTVPFENISVQLGHRIDLDVPSLERKLVEQRRGGYCFEQNGLFSAVLEELGFTVTRLAARVRLGASRMLPRTHMLLLVECEGSSWVADVGFGGWSLLEPIPLIAGVDMQQGVWSVRLERENDSWILRAPQCAGGPDLYAFTLEPQQPIDYEPANHYCATHPNSRFVQTFTVQLPGFNVRTILRGRELIVADASGSHTTMIDGSEQLLGELETRFNLVLSRDLRDALAEKLR